MSFEECPKGGQHEWKKVYYLTECSKCGLFYPDGCEPWDPRNWEEYYYEYDEYHDYDAWLPEDYEDD